MFESRKASPDRKRFLYLRVLIDYLKTNGHRIAHHAMSRTPTPLASRNDIQPLLLMINGEIADILTLDSNSKKTFVKSVEYDELSAHFLGDMALNDSLGEIQKENLDDIHFIFVTNGVFTPEFLQAEYLDKFPFLSKITFLETRFDPESIHKIGNPSIYMRRSVAQIRQVNTSFIKTSEQNCECGGKYLQGTYKITYWGKSKTLEYSICTNCGIQLENTENADTIMSFVQGLSAE